jgi:hypothetical protein
VEEEKHGNSLSIQTACFLGRCHARSGFHAWRKGKNGPQLAVGSLESKNTRLFRDLFLGNVPTRLEAFPALFLNDVTLPKAVDWLPVPSHVEIADTLGNAVTFLRLALRQATHTLFSSQGTANVFFSSGTQVEMLRARAQATITLPHGLKHRGLRWAKAQIVRGFCLRGLQCLLRLFLSIASSSVTRKAVKKAMESIERVM